MSSQVIYAYCVYLPKTLVVLVISALMLGLSWAALRLDPTLSRLDRLEMEDLRDELREVCHLHARTIGALFGVGGPV